MRVQQAIKIEYPTSDGKPMAETPLHRDAHPKGERIVSANVTNRKR